MKSYHPYDRDRKLPYSWEDPEGVPRNYDELFRDHEAFIMKILHRHNKVSRNMEDLHQGIWLQLINANVLKKFVNGAARRLPLEMTSVEVLRFLGVDTWQKWTYFLRNHEIGSISHPLRGDRFAQFAVWETTAVCEFDYHNMLKLKGKPKKIRPKLTNWGFKTYLQSSIHNAFANLCRTQARRNQESLLAPQTVLTHQSDGSYRQSTSIEDFSSWEVNITAAMTDEEGLLDLADMLRKANVDVNSDEGIEVLDTLAHQGAEFEDGPRRNEELLKLLGQGTYTLEEAARRVRHRARLWAKT